ncbi:MAG: type II toxin-antitoxin system VapC family toxin [Lautropia sp.]|nr:type II toxin-antitoxin system VapC family toxin [Lautropia sp.]
MYLLDTNVISELRPNKPHASRSVMAWADTVKIGSLYLSSITTFELELGVLQLERKGEGQKLRAWLNALLQSFSGRILPYDVETSLLCARMHSPDPKSPRDAMIAAIAMRHDCTLVTRNTRDFARIDVPVFNPWQHHVLQEPGPE